MSIFSCFLLPNEKSGCRQIGRAIKRVVLTFLILLRRKIYGKHPICILFTGRPSVNSNSDDRELNIEGLISFEQASIGNMDIDSVDLCSILLYFINF